MKKLIWLGLFVGSSAGSYVPSLFGSDMFSVWSMVGGVVGGVAGIFGGYKIARTWDL